MGFTKEQLRERARGKVKSLEFAVTQAAFADSRAELEEELELARIALASLEAEGKLSNFVASQESLGGDFEKVLAENIEGLYVSGSSAHPAPVSVSDELAGKSFNYIANKFQVSTSEAQWILVGWNACRAAMLQGKAELVSNRDELKSPVVPDGWVMVPVEPTMEMLDEFDSIIDYGAEDSKDAWSRLIAAVPKQEA